MAQLMAWLVLCSALTIFGAANAGNDTTILRVTSLLVEPYLMKNYTGSDVYYGMIVDILSEIERTSELRFHLNVASDSKYGVLTNETWNGLIGQLIDETADLAAAPLAVTMTREKYVDFLVPFQSSEAMIVLNKHRRSHVSVHGLDDLLDQNSLQYGVVKGSTLLHQMASSKNHDIQRVAETMLDHPSWLKASNTDGVYAVRRNPNYAFILEGSAARYIASRPPCDLDIVPTDFNHRQYAFAVRNVSPLRDVINEALVELRESGELARLEQKWWPDLCGGAAASSGAPVGLMMAVLVVAVSLFTNVSL